MTLAVKQSGLPYVINLTLTEANTEYSYSLGPYVKKFVIQDRDFDDIKLAFTEGESGSNYFTLKGSAAYYEDHVFGPITIYMQSPKAGTIAELVIYSARD
jgi:hypothetical protein